MSDLTLGEALAAAQARVDPVDARVLLCYAVGRDSSYVIAHPEVPLRPQEQQNFLGLVDRRSKGEPVAYLTGEREFYGRLFRITPAVLIPRPETELLVDFALERVPQEGLFRVLELGTGSGCVAISIASERPNAKVLALDRSLDALALARKNAVQTNVGNVAFLRSDWFSALRSEHFDMIVANPPYVASTDPHLSQGDLRYEPRAALDGGPDGLEAVRQIVAGGKTHLTPGGGLLFEHGHDQGERARLLLHAAGFVEIFTAHDTAGIERVTAGKLTNELRLQ
jgi:release factor glutamine methyltransferase